MIYSPGGTSNTKTRNATYEAIDVADYDDQNDDEYFRGPRPPITTAYRNIDSDIDEEEIIQEQAQENEEEQYGAHVTTRHRQRLPMPRPQAGYGRYAEPPRHEDPDPLLVRSVSREGSTLSHPTPDLQSFQGAYTGNVSRLEESAERLSLSSDIGEELRKLHSELKRADSYRSSGGGGGGGVSASRQFSSSSHTNSIIGFNSVARSGGFSHEGYVTSPLSSMRSPNWSQLDYTSSRDQQVPYREPLQEGKPLDSPVSKRSNVLTVRNQDTEDSPRENAEGRHIYSQPREDRYGENSGSMEHTQVKRTASVASKNTYRQAEDAFADFDGVHIGSPVDEIDAPVIKVPKPRKAVTEPIQKPVQSQTRDSKRESKREPKREQVEEPIDRGMNFSPTLAESMQTYTRMPDPSESGMVFYPAPVPMMLNLPQKLSKSNEVAKMAQRRSQFMLPKRRSMTNVLEDGLFASEEEEKAKLPSQLRASMFFDHPSVPHDVEVKGGSAVATLDSILDASAHAPVGAFTDHPIVGQAGGQVYGKEQPSARRPLQKRSQSTTDVLENDHKAQRRSFLGFGKKQKSHSSTINVVREKDEAEAAGEEASLRQSLEEERLEGEKEDQDAQIEEDVRRDRPTTLLAELQMRKVEQSKRNRTAATAFPDGMRSTLLQLDAVTQHQIAARKQKHVTLAWEDPSAANEPEPDETEDVPLGMLYASGKLRPKSQAHWDEDRPLGLLAQRQMEESEPLSARRARLRGEPKPEPGQYRQSFMLAPSPDPEEPAEVDEEEEETLAQRRRRLAIKDAIPVTRPVSGDFSSELLSQLGAAPPTSTEATKPQPPPATSTPEQEETLGQRRKRLQAEKAAAAAAAAASRQVSGESDAQPNQGPSASSKRRSMADLLSAHPTGPHASARDSTQARGLLAFQQAHQHQRLSAASPTQLLRGAYNPDQNHHHQQQQQTQLQPGMGMQHANNLNLAPGYYMPQQMPYGRSMGAAGQEPVSAAGAGGVGVGVGGPGTYVNPMTYTPMMGLNGGVSPVPAYQAMAGLGAGKPLDYTPLDNKRRDMIDRWRQSVV